MSDCRCAPHTDTQVACHGRRTHALSCLYIYSSPPLHISCTRLHCMWRTIHRITHIGLSSHQATHAHPEPQTSHTSAHSSPALFVRCVCCWSRLPSARSIDVHTAWRIARAAPKVAVGRRTPLSLSLMCVPAAQREERRRAINRGAFIWHAHTLTLTLMA